MANVTSSTADKNSNAFFVAAIELQPLLERPTNTPYSVLSFWPRQDERTDYQILVGSNAKCTLQIDKRRREVEGLLEKWM